MDLLPEYQDMSNGVICDTAEKCQTAATALETSHSLVFDCEGDKLGISGGRLSIILLRGVTADSQTYIIDVPRLSLSSLQPILDLLRSPNIRKVVFDGRMDFSALYHELEVELQNVLDLQLVDIMSRFARGEGWETQRRRLRSFLKTDELRTHPQLYVQVHRLGGLDGCIAEHAVIPRKVGEPVKSKVGHDLWMNRPLPDEYLEYASRDAFLIYSLYNYFSRVGYLDLVTVERSMRYVSLHRHSPPHRDGIYTSQHPLLPLGILGEDPICGLTKRCLRCNRNLSLFGFSPDEMGSRCFVCRAIDIRRQSKQRGTTETKVPRVGQVVRMSDPQSSAPVTLGHDAMGSAVRARARLSIPHGYSAHGLSATSQLSSSWSPGGASGWVYGDVPMRYADSGRRNEPENQLMSACANFVLAVVKAISIYS